MTKASKKGATQRLAAAALMTAVGLIFPYLTGHAFGIPGTVLLPMHLPVLLCGLLCGPWYGAACGLVVPVLSSLLTGMPPLFPMLPPMAAQLLVMGLVSGLIAQRTRLPRVAAVAVAIVGGLAAFALAARVLVFAGVQSAAGLSIVSAVVTGLPGIAIQLILLPVLLRVLASRGVALAQPPAAPDKLAEAKGIIQRGEATCVVLQDGRIVHIAEGRGVSPILKLYDNKPETLRGAVVADKIIGKGAAMLLVLGGAAEVYGEIMSRAGQEYLTAHGVPASYGRCVDMLSNRDKTGICPIEQSVLDIDDPAEGLVRIRETIARLMQSAG